MKRNHGKMRKREALKIALYNKALEVAVRHGRKWGCVDRADQEDAAGEAYLAAARKALDRLDRPGIRTAEGFAATVAYRETRMQLRKNHTEKKHFEKSFLRLDEPDPERRIEPGDGGAGVERVVQALDIADPMPAWQRLTRLTYEGLPPDLKRIARAFLTVWHPEEVRAKLAIPKRKFYRQLKKVKKLFWPCFIGLERWNDRRSR